MSTKNDKNERISQHGYRAIPHGIKIDEKEREKLGLSNNGKPWEKQDDAVIVKMFANGATCKQVASVLKRTVVSIQTRASALHSAAKTQKEGLKYRNQRTGGDKHIKPAVDKRIDAQALLIRDTIADKRSELERAAKKTVKKTVKK